MFEIPVYDITSVSCGGVLEVYDTNTLYPICTASKVNECKINAHKQ